MVQGVEETDVNREERVERKIGYVFGNKGNWTPKMESGCLSCNRDGTCTVDKKEGSTCPVTGCKPPDPKPDATARGNMFNVGNRVKYECIGMRVMTGAKRHISTCLENGTWSTTDFQCLYDCGSAPTIQNGLVTVDDIHNTTEGATATVTCDNGYQYDLATIVCLNTGRWQTPTCTIRDCGTTPLVNNGSVKLDQPGISTFGATATVECILGYEPRKNAITCQPSGIWPIPECKGPIFICKYRRKYAVSAACGSCVAECVDGVDKRTCSCTDNLQRFISLPGYYIKSNGVGEGGYRRTEAGCMASCHATPRCKSVDYNHDMCYFNNKLPHEVEPHNSSNWSILLRQCDFC